MDTNLTIPVNIPGTESFVQDMNPYAGKYKRPITPPEPLLKLADKNPPIVPIARTSPVTSQHIKMSVRLPKGIVTSLTIKKNIIALWILYTCDPETLNTEIIDSSEASEAQSLTQEDIIEDEETIYKLVNTFVYKCLEGWDKESGKGLSDFVTELMIEDFLDDYDLYESLLPLIKG